MARIVGWLGILIIIGGAAYSSLHFYQWWGSKQSIHEIEEKDENKVEQTEMSQPVLEEENHEEDFSTLSTDYNVGEEVAKLIIPKLDISYDVFWGTDEDTLAEGVGMYVSQLTNIPNPEGGHTVLSGHRDTVFRKLGELENGDTLTVQYEGEEYRYSIKKIWITDPEDRTVIVEKDKPTLTLTTCYPFYYVGPAPERYIVQAEFESLQ